MNHKVTHAANTIQVIKECLESREWWIWIPVGVTGARELQKIEKAFYWDDANVDFNVAFFPSRLFFVALGKKTRASAQQLQKLIVTTAQVQLTSETDVMVLVAEDDEQGKMWALNNLSHLLSSYHPELN